MLMLLVLLHEPVTGYSYLKIQVSSHGEHPLLSSVTGSSFIMYAIKLTALDHQHRLLQSVHLYTLR